MKGQDTYTTIEQFQKEWLEASTGSVLFWAPTMYAGFKYIPQHSRSIQLGKGKGEGEGEDEVESEGKVRVGVKVRVKVTLLKYAPDLFLPLLPIPFPIGSCTLQLAPFFIRCIFTDECV